MVDLDAVIVGSGFAGVCVLHCVRGLGLTARVYEAGSGVGGTWFWNRYPGARCDVESMEYADVGAPVGGTSLLGCGLPLQACCDGAHDCEQSFPSPFGGFSIEPDQGREVGVGE
jgi:predicted NAD/FAD-dependent oxidoreductase